MAVRGRRHHRANKFAHDVLANVSHEIRTPLTPIKGYAEMLRRRADDPEFVAAAIDSIVESSDRLDRAVEKLTVASALQSGHLQPRFGVVAVPELLEESLRRSPLVERFDDIYLSGDIEGPVLCDRNLLSLAVAELVENAVKFSPNGEAVDVVVRRDERTVCVAVHDRGIGIPADQSRRIFGAFAQVNASPSRVYDGLGLGLTLVKSIVDIHGGSLRVRANNGAGSTFEIRIPATVRDNARALSRVVKIAAVAVVPALVALFVTRAAAIDAVGSSANAALPPSTAPVAAPTPGAVQVPTSHTLAAVTRGPASASTVATPIPAGHGPAQTLVTSAAGVRVPVALNISAPTAEAAVRELQL